MTQLTPEQEREVERLVDQRIRDAQRKPSTGPVSGWVIVLLLAGAVGCFIYLSRDELGSTPAEAGAPPVREEVVVPPQTVWASGVVSASAHRLPNQDQHYAPSAALGPPDVFPLCQESGDSFMTDPADTARHYIEVSYESEVEASAVILLLSYGAGSLARVTVGGREEPVWQGTAEPSCSRAFRYPLEPPGRVATVRVEVDPSRSAPVGIDAIGLVPVGAEP